MKIAQVALDVPLDATFDFRVPEGLDPGVGSLVVVPFGRARKVGRGDGTESAAARSPASACATSSGWSTTSPRWASAELDLYRFCAAYYQRPMGEVIGDRPPATHLAR